MNDAEMFRWAATQMAWERAKAKERGTQIPRVRGITELNTKVQAVLTNRPLDVGRRGRWGAGLIEQAVRRAYRLGIE